ncbi:MAG: hypothetical protein HYX20_02195 [Candidatus Yanofskybacteria bacterium]|nr:hypothetical protein [Candidatus Yanofskybacteria bacterium]
MKHAKRQTLILVAASFLFFGLALSQEGPAPTPPQDGKAKCHNFTKDGQKPNCTCWGNANPNDPKYPNCKPQGEDPKCTNHCKRYMCECKPKCQS